MSVLRLDGLEDQFRCYQCHTEISTIPNIQCKLCLCIYHKRCVFIPDNISDENPWYCHSCSLQTFPFANLEDDEILDVFFSYQLCDVEGLPDILDHEFFTPNIDDERDPDNFFPRFSSNYCPPNLFENYMNSDKDDFSMAHMNVVSLNDDKLQLIKELLVPLHNPLKILALSETALKEGSPQITKLAGYHPFLRDDTTLARGGVGLYIHSSLKFDKRPDLKIEQKNCENLWVEVEMEGGGKRLLVLFISILVTPLMS